MRTYCILLAALLTLWAPTAFAARSDVDLNVDADVDMSVAARAAARGEGRFSYAWDWGDGEAGAGASARHTYRAPGVYRVVVTVTDDAGEEYRRTREVTVKAPATEWDVGQDGARVQAKADVDARVRVVWDWGDGEVTVGRRASHRYELPGTYQVVASFERGSSCWTERRVIVVHGEEEGAESEEEDEDESERSRGVHARVSVGAPSVHVGLGWGRADGETRSSSSSWRSDSSVSTSSSDRHDAPGVPAPLILGLVGFLAVGARKLLRR